MESRSCFARAALLWAAYLFIILFCTLPRGAHTWLVHFGCTQEAIYEETCKPQLLTPLSTNADIILLYGESDAVNLAKHAKDFAERHDWLGITSWPLWPPGMIAIYTLLYALSPDAPIGLVLLCFDACLWALAFTVMYFFLHRKIGDVIAFSLPLVLLLTTEFAYFFTRGAYMSESPSIAAFLLAVGLLLQAIEQKRVGFALAAGAAMAFSAYMRAQTDLVMTLLLPVALLGLALFYLRRRGQPLMQSSIGMLTVMLLCYHGLTLPYRAMHDMRMIDISNNPMWFFVWEHKDDIQAKPGLRFYATGGGEEACFIDPQLCAQIHARRAANPEVYARADYYHLAVASALNHPLLWIKYKYPALRHFWLETPAEGMLLLLLLPLVLVTCLKRRDEMHGVLALLLVVTGIGIVVPPFLSHFEPRYLYQFKLLILYAAIVLAADIPLRKVHVSHS